MTGALQRLLPLPDAATTGWPRRSSSPAVARQPRRGGCSGALGAVRRAVRAAAGRGDAARAAGALPPQRRSSGSASARLLGRPARMILRNLERQPVRTADLGARHRASPSRCSCSARSSSTSIDDADATCSSRVVQRQDVTVDVRRAAVAAARSTSCSACRACSRSSRRACCRCGCAPATASRAIGADRAWSREPRLQRVVDSRTCRVPAAAAGLVLSPKLAEILGVGAGDIVDVEVLEGGRPVRARCRWRARRGVHGHRRPTWTIDALHAADARRRARSRARSCSSIRATGAALYARLKDMPAVAGVALQARRARELPARHMARRSTS